MQADTLKYPIGKYQIPSEITPGILAKWIGIIAAFPEELRTEVAHLKDDQLNTPYREGGWTIRQVVHHVADSHMNSYIRFKLALTEDMPTIKPYEQARWAELEDGKNGPIDMSLNLLHGLHGRWVLFLQSLKSDDWTKQFRHPEYKNTLRINENLGLYAWHCEHHLRHIRGLKERKGW